MKNFQSKNNSKKSSSRSLPGHEYSKNSKKLSEIHSPTSKRTNKTDFKFKLLKKNNEYKKKLANFLIKSINNKKLWNFKIIIYVF